MRSKTFDRSRARPDAISVSEIIERVSRSAPAAPARPSIADDDTQPLPLVALRPRRKGHLVALSGCAVVVAAAFTVLSNLDTSSGRANTQPAPPSQASAGPSVPGTEPAPDTTTTVPADTVKMTASPGGKSTRRDPAARPPAQQNASKDPLAGLRELEEALKKSLPKWPGG